jgi:hypothetical protein
LPDPPQDGPADPLANPGPDGGPDPLPELNVEELETLWDALDPVLDGFGAGESCLDDASAFLARLGIQAQGPGEGETGSPLLQWLERWRAAGGNRETLRLMVRTLLASR